MDTAPERPTAVFADGSRDQRIIDLTIAGDEEALRRFSKKAGTRIERVRARARRIGLTPHIVRSARRAGTRPKVRKCLRCDQQFMSKGRHNRMCSRCARKS
jgi:hypothetical protein